METFIGIGAAAIVVFSIRSLVLAWRRADDRSLAQTLDESVGSTAVTAFFGAALFGLLTHHSGMAVLGIGVVAAVLLGLAAKVVGYLDRRADRRRRRLLGLAVPRRFVPPWVVAVGYGSVAFLVAPLFNVLIMSVAAAATGDKTYLEMPLRAHGGWAFGISFLSYIAVTVLFGLWLTHRQRRKIEAEHARVADLDRKIALESPDEATD
ncbi:hypothetical protein [Mycobacteroides abscessus]|uniref:hypothetical protein n=1 Tax=Mycobacteroides abscessus TaxID=36809 RepID=UPI00089DC694|nr:hypothetical protein [Mycobacteroides abscessus]MBE5408352.1 hypothetical protein [Mycobacteroides abscessus]MBE5433313.1 hypothetical protein [Mycobacteroides abscessus]MBE5502659.1 hypothetical protein [Mycobacteroides abscessus]MBN7428903.1 hypothetical protein [Mycobacteroides abscessus subsp. massiliense]MBN7468949.1 hypothetical protein [Mycobacteroides abscessus subsp. massiliense]